jgi:hypothetical protein
MKNILIILIFLYYHPAFSKDLNLRIEQKFSAEIIPWLKLKFYSVEQLNNNFSQFSYFETGIGMAFTLPVKWLFIDPFYRQAVIKNVNGYWELEPSPNLNIITQFTLHKFSGLFVNNRFRFAYRFKLKWHDFRIRNFLKIGINKILLKPYIGWELFYSNHERLVNQHLIYIGVEEMLYKKISIFSYYRILVNCTKTDSEIKAHQFGIGLKVYY